MRLQTLILAIAACTVMGAAEPLRLQVTGLKEPAEILIDRWGVPHIYATTFDDAFFAQGFNAARDRLFQIDLWRRRGLGRLAEVLGPAYVEQDKAARLFLYRGDMDTEWAAYGPDARRMATAFAAGINAYVDWVAARLDRMPVEFRLLGYGPSKWEPGDVVRIRSHGLTGNLTEEVARSNVVCKTGARNGLNYDQVRRRLEPKHESTIPEGLDPCLPADVLQKFILGTQSVLFNGHTRRGGRPDGDGSNNWTIAPAKSATGRPIVANDPHRAYTTPSLRYIAHLSAPGLNVIGAGEPALPGISTGHNDTIAFGITRFYIDQEDLYVYELNPANAREYRYGQKWEPLRIVHEAVLVKDAPPVEAELAFTRHGPVIYADTRRAFAVRSCWLEPGTAAYFGSASYMFSRNLREFQESVARAGAPGLNYVYGDVKGDIGWVVGGRAPIRPNWDGLMPVPGDGRYEWAGFWPARQLPSTINPSNGYISTSNEMNLPADYPWQERRLGFEWVNSSRHERIEEVLKSLSKVSIEDSMKLQNDITSIPARRLVRVLASLSSGDRRTAAALELLQGWDGSERADSAQAALMEVWVSRHLEKAFLAAVLPKDALAAVSSADMGVMLDALEMPEGPFKGDGNGTAREKRDRMLLASLAAAYAEMENLQGTDAKAWRWGNLHHSLPAHPLLATVDGEARARLQVGPFAKSGGPYTPNQSSYRTSDFQLTTGASFRMVLDVGSWDDSRAVNYPGQSGSPDDAHYRDLVDMWLAGEYFPLLYTRTAIEKATETRIALVPTTK
jgi:penicillin amidase